MRKNKKPVEEPVVVNVNKSGWEIHNGPEMTIEEMFAPFIKFVGLKELMNLCLCKFMFKMILKFFFIKTVLTGAI